ncbi:MAG: isoaspartyl peptidase/L-asparaginase [Myxococcaceae bacterium]
MSHSILVHGGAGERVADDDPKMPAEGCLAAARAGHAVLSKGGSALDAVIAAVRVLEDDPQFNAGTGSTLNSDGDVETDASVMTGEGGAGAVAALRDVKNPIVVARLVMEKTPHVVLSGEGARRFAAEQGISMLPPGAMVIPAARERWQKAVAERAKPSGHGTVGAVACDGQGRVAAATSTGGTFMKLPGRLGDTPQIGAGTYAEAGAGAVSCTGLGEAIIKSALSFQMVRAMRGGTPISALATELCEELTRFNGKGGLIAVAPDAKLGHGFNTARMARGWVDRDGNAWCGFGVGDDRQL